MGYRVAVIGATGNVGGAIVQLLLQSPRCGKVVVVSRRPSKTAAHPKLVEVVVNIDRLAEDIASHAAGIDAAFAPASLKLEDFRLLAMDMDSTLITIECIDEIADMQGLKAEVAEITEAAMRGELDFQESLKRRVALLKGLDASALQRVYEERLQLSPGAERLIAAAQAAVDSQLKLPPGYSIDWGGQFENLPRAKARLTVILPITIAIIFILLFFMFGSAKYAGMVLMNVPFSLVGGVLFLYIRQINLSVSAAVGFISLFGVAVMSGVLVIAEINRLRRSQPEQSVQWCIVHGALGQLRPVLLMVIVALLGMVPAARASVVDIGRDLNHVVSGRAAAGWVSGGRPRIVCPDPDTGHQSTSFENQIGDRATGADGPVTTFHDVVTIISFVVVRS